MFRGGLPHAAFEPVRPTLNTMLNVRIAHVSCIIVGLIIRPNIRR